MFAWSHTVLYNHCQSANIVKNGIAPNGKQKYRCLDCVLGKTAPSGPARKRLEQNGTEIARVLGRVS